MLIRCLLLISAGLLMVKSEADDTVPEKRQTTTLQDIPVIAAESLTDGQWAEFVPITRDQLSQLMEQYSQQQTSIEQTRYSARLSGNNLVDGTIAIDFPKTGSTNSVSLGHTNFSHIKLFANGIEVPLASHSELGLIPLMSPDTRQLTGDWSATGILRGRSIVFDLKLPSADISSMKITTDAQTQIRSPNAVVRSLTAVDANIVWELFPANPAKLTIECQRTNVDKGEPAFVSVNGQFNLQLNQAEAAWSIAVPKSLAGAKVRFRVAGDVKIEGVAVGDSEIRWQRFNQQESGFLETDVPDNISGPLTIVGYFEPTANGQYHFPFLTPDVYSLAGLPNRPISLRTSSIKASVNAQIVVTELELSGLYKKDVSFAGDRDVVMEFEQFSTSASAVISITKALPLIQDAVVVKIESLAANVDAFAYAKVSARSGTVNTLTWDVPKNWRVTDVRELSPDSPPLLYRLLDDTSETTRLEVTLRNPLTSNSPAQMLMVRMQSVENSPTSQQQPAGLLTSEYQRTTDLLALPEELAKAIMSSWTASSATKPDATKAAAWLPVGTVTDLGMYSRSELKPTESLSTPGREIDAAIDYSVEVRSTDIVETANIRIHSGSELPIRIPLTFSTDVVPELRVTDRSASLLRMGNAEDNQWVLEISADEPVISEIEFTLTARSPLQSQTDGMTIQFSNCRQTGRILPPDPDSGVTMSIQTETLSTVVSSIMEYPNEPFTLDLRRNIRTVAPLQISGRGFVMISGDKDGPVLNAICRCLVTSSGSRHLEFTATTLINCDVLIAGRKVHAEWSGDVIRIPLPEQQTPIAIDVLFSARATTDNTLTLPLIGFGDSQAEVSWFLLPEEGQTITAPEDQTLLTSSASTVGELISSVDPSIDEPKPVLNFASRWMLQANHQTSCVVVPFVSETQSTNLIIKDRSLWSGQILLWATASLLFWRWVSAFTPWRSGVAILILLSMRLMLTDTHPIVEGCLGGTLVFCVLSLGRKLIQQAMPGSRMHQNQTSKLAAGGLLIALAPAFASAQVDSTIPKLFAPGNKSPIVYVQRSLLNSLQQSSTESALEIAVLDTELDISIESSKSASAKIKTVVAGASTMPQHLVLPLDDVTLVDCKLNGETVFPRRNPSGKTLVTISSDAVLPEKTLSPQQLEMAAGPRTLGEWSLHTIEYQIRIPARSVNGQFRLQIPVPLSPTTNTSVTDASASISRPRLKTSSLEFKGTATVATDSVYSFPAVANSSSLEILADLNSEPETGTTIPNAKVACQIDALPDKLQITTEYRVLQSTPDENTLQLGANPESIVSVKSETGASIPWTALSDGIEVTLPSDEANQQVVIVRQESDTSLSLERKIAFESLRRVNKRPASESSVSVRTTDQFIVDEVLGDGMPLQTIAAPTSETETTRATERRVIVPTEVQTLYVKIAERISTQLIEDVSQEAVVRDTSIDWSCRFRSEIAGQPAFRQVVMLPEDIRVDQVTATLVGTDRLQSWSRTRNSVVVFLREATRGTLEIQVSGTIPRFIGKPTSLPFAGFPADAQVLQSSLRLRSESSRGAFISSFGGAQPDEKLDINAPLTSTALRLSVIKDSRPLIIRESEQQSAAISIAVLIYESAGQTRTATVMQVKPKETTAPLKFRNRNNDIESQRPIVFQNNEVIDTFEENGAITIPPTFGQPETSSTVIVFPNGIPIARNDSLQVQTPEFDVATQVVSCVCYEMQPAGQINPLRSSVPAWVTEAVKGISLSPEQNSRTQTAQFDPVTRRVQIRLAQQNQSLPEATVTPGVFYVDCEHFVQPDSNGITGTSGFLVFASQSRSNFRVQIPTDMIVTRMTVDGSSIPLNRSEGGVSVILPSRVSHIVADWITQTDLKPGTNRQKISFPSVNSAQGQTRVAVKPVESRFRWQVAPTSVQTMTEFQDGRTSSILTGLQMLEVESREDSVADFTVKSAVPVNLINQIYMQSRSAAQSADRLFAQNEQAQNVPVTIAGNTLILSDLRLPSPVLIFSLLLAVSLVVAPWFRSGTKKPTVPDSESSTIIQRASQAKSDVLLTEAAVNSPEDLAAK